MRANIPGNLKEKVDVLEKSLLAIDTLNNICLANWNSGAPVIDLQDCAHLLNHLIEPAMFQVESLRMMIDELQPQQLKAA